MSLQISAGKKQVNRNKIILKNGEKKTNIKKGQLI